MRMCCEVALFNAFNTSALARMLALSVSSTWYGLRADRGKNSSFSSPKILSISLSIYAACSLSSATMQCSTGILGAIEDIRNDKDEPI